MIEGEVVEIEIDKPVQGTASKTVRIPGQGFTATSHNMLHQHAAMRLIGNIRVGEVDNEDHRYGDYL